MQVCARAIFILLQIFLHPHHFKFDSLVVQVQLSVKLFSLLELFFLLLEASSQFLEEVGVLQLVLSGKYFGVFFFKLLELFFLLRF